MSRERRPVELDRTRDLSTILRDALAVWVRNLRVFVPIAIVVVVPVDAAVLGLGLGEFHGHYTSSPTVAQSLVAVGAQLLVTTPLVSVMCVHALTELGAGTRPSPWRSIMAGLDAFATVFWPVLAGLAAVVVTLPILIGIVLFVRWYFVPQVVFADRRSGLNALRGSWELTGGFALRVVAIVIVANLLFGIAAGAVAGPLLSAAKSADSQALVLGYTTLAETLVVVPVALVAALLFFDLRARRRP